MLAHESGVRCLSLAVCQTGHTVQDIAMLRAISYLAQRYLPDCADHVFPVFHQFMGAFPTRRLDADALILRGAMAAKAGGAVKVINKTHQEAYGVPSLDANISGILLSKTVNSWILDLIQAGAEKIEEELHWQLEEVDALLAPILDSPDLLQATCAAFANGRLDVPFSASRYAQARVIPMRAPDGAIRIFDFGNLSIPHRVRQRHRHQLDIVIDEDLFTRLEADIMWFCRNNATAEITPSGNAEPQLAFQAS